MNVKVTFTMFLLKTFGFLMDKIAQYENNMIYIIKKQEGFFQNKVNSSLVSSCTYKLQGFKSCPNTYTVRESLVLL